MVPQKLDFNGPIRQYIHNFHEAPKVEAKNMCNTVALTPTQKEAVHALSKEMGIGVSTFIGQAIDLKVSLLQISDKLQENSEKLVRHWRLIANVLDNLT